MRQLEPTPPEAITGITDGAANHAQQFEVEAFAGAVAVHRGEENLAGAQSSATRLAQSMTSNPVLMAAAMRKDLPFAGSRLRPGIPACVDGDDDRIGCRIFRQLPR